MRPIRSASSPMRSRSVIVLMMATIRRKSLAVGWRLVSLCALLVDRDFQCIDLVIVGDDHFAEAAVSGNDRADRVCQLLFDHPAHDEYYIADVFELFVELL